MRAAASIRSPETLAKLSAAQSTSMKVEVTDMETNTSTTYHAIKAAARALGIDRRYIEHYIFLNQDKPVLGRYTFKLLNSVAGGAENSSPGGPPRVPYGVPFGGSLISIPKVQKTSMKVEVTNVETKEVTIYPSIGAAARAYKNKKKREI
jgi:hypothetical protein